jgi:hypothetical protein
MRTKYEVADIIRKYGDEFYERYAVVPQVRKSFSSMALCRTQALGGHIDVCPSCGTLHISYNSCRDRHCPKCQHKEREIWIEARKEEVIPTKYFHVVFTVPDCLHPVAMAHQKEFYNSMFKAAWSTIAKFARSEGVQPGMTSILHTWGSNMFYHPHLHCIVPGGGLDDTGTWHDFKGSTQKSTFLFPVLALSKVFRAKMLGRLTETLGQEGVVINQDIRKKAMEKPWVVYSRPPAKGVNQVLEYIGRYAYRVAISNSRIKDITPDGMVTYDYKDYRCGGKHKLMTVRATDFLHLFSMHILPPNMVRIRHYGLLSTSNRDKLRSAQTQLHAENVLPKNRKKKTLLQISEEHGWNIGRCSCGETLLVLRLIPSIARSPPCKCCPDIHQISNL